MDRNTKTLAIGGVGIAAAVALGLSGATLAGADDSSTGTSSSAEANNGYGMPGGGKGMRDAGGELSADAAGKAVAAAEGEVDGGTVTGVRALSDGTYEVTVVSDAGRVDVLVSATFEVTGTEDHSQGMGGMRGGPDHDGDGPGAPGGTGTESGDPSDANGSADAEGMSGVPSPGATPTATSTTAAV